MFQIPHLEPGSQSFSAPRGTPRSPSHNGETSHHFPIACDPAERQTSLGTIRHTPHSAPYVPFCFIMFYLFVSLAPLFYQLAVFTHNKTMARSLYYHKATAPICSGARKTAQHLRRLP
jgi:hypothetical protein